MSTVRQIGNSFDDELKKEYEKLNERLDDCIINSTGKVDLEYATTRFILYEIASIKTYLKSLYSKTIKQIEK